MNVDNILKLAAIIEAEEHTSFLSDTGFSMSNYTHHCGAPCCIAGFAAAQAGCAGELDSVKLKSAARDWLGLDPNQAYSLFMPNTSVSWKKITPAQAALCLRNLAETGVVDWRHVPAEQ